MTEPGYSKVCWNCGQETMEKTGDFYTCQNCGATWNECIDYGSAIGIVRESGAQDGGMKHKPVKSKGTRALPLSPKERKAKAEARQRGMPIY